MSVEELINELLMCDRDSRVVIDYLGCHDVKEVIADSDGGPLGKCVKLG